MQTTPQPHDTAVNATPVNAMHDMQHAPHHDDVKADKQPDSLETEMAIQNLFREEADLRWRAGELEAQANSLDEGDDESRMQADKLRTKRSEELALADVMKETAVQIKNDPSKKHLRVKIAALTSQASFMITESEHDAEAANAVHATATDHKVTLQHTVVEESSKVAARSKPAAEHHTVPARKKSGGASKQQTATKKAPAPQAQQHWVAAPKAQTAQQQIPIWGMGYLGTVTPGHQPYWWGQEQQQPAATPVPQPNLWQGYAFTPANPFAIAGMPGMPLWNQAEVNPQPTPQPVHPAATGKPIAGQVVAAVKNVKIPTGIGPVSPHPVSDSLTPSVFTAPWNVFMTPQGHS